MTANLTFRTKAAALCACAALAMAAPAQAQAQPIEPAQPQQASAMPTLPHTMVIAALMLKLKTIQESGTTTIDATLDAAMPIVGSVTNDVEGLKSARKVVQTGTAQNLGGNLSQTNVAVECAAVAVTGAVATHVRSCYLQSATGAIYRVPSTGAKPGAADASVGGTLLVPNRAYKVCVESQALFQDSQYLLTPVVCSG